MRLSSYGHKLTRMAVSAARALGRAASSAATAQHIGDAAFMGEALLGARRAAAGGEVPVGAVLVLGGVVRRRLRWARPCGSCC